MALLLGLLFILLCTDAAKATDRDFTYSHVTLVVVPGLTYSSLIASQDPTVQSMIYHFGIALLSPGNPHKPDAVENLYATVFAGDTANIRNPNKDLLIRTIAFSNRPASVQIVRSATLTEAAMICEGVRERHDAVVVCGLPPVDPKSGEWDQLSVAIIAEPLGASLLRSATTQTLGLVALRDIAPTVLHLAGFPIPPTMTGVPIYSSLWVAGGSGFGRTPSSFRILERMDTISRLNQRTLLPTMWTYGSVSLIALLVALWSLAHGVTIAPGALRYFIRMMMALPLALLIAPVFNPQTLPVYGALIAGIGIALGAIPSMGAIAALTAAVVLIDGVTGTHLVAVSALSGYWLSGIRFYGIGNEYMGVAIGSLLVVPYFMARRWPGIWKKRGASALLAALFAAALFVLSYPAFGAKAGGAITAMTAFVPVWLHLTRQRALTWRVFALSALAGFAMVFVWAVVAHFTGARVTHIQTATEHASHGDVGYIWHIALRKAKMAVLTATVPGVLATYIGLIPAWLLWKRTPLRERVRAFLAADPVFGGIMRCAVGTSAAALMFNDSGFVAMVFIFGSVCVTMIHEMLGTRAVVEEVDNGSGKTLAADVI